MDARRFDDIARLLTATPTRRALVGLTGLAGLVWLGTTPEAEAKRRKGKKKGKGKGKPQPSDTCTPACKECQTCTQRTCQTVADGAACSGGKVCAGGTCVPLRCGNGGPCTLFVTNQRFDGSRLGGLDGADALCATAASEAGLSGTFMAWLSSSESSPTTRFTKVAKAGPYRLVRSDGDGANLPPNVAASFTDLVECNLPGSDCLQHAIDRTERGVTLEFEELVWTGTLSRGESAPDTCSGFTARGAGASGDLRAKTGAWTNNEVAVCVLSGRLYCFEQAS